MNSLIESLRVFRQRDRSQSQRRAAEEERRLAVEEALDNEDEKAAITETINVGTSLFEMYLSLQHMAS